MYKALSLQTYHKCLAIFPRVTHKKRHASYSEGTCRQYCWICYLCKSYVVLFLGTCPGCFDSCKSYVVLLLGTCLGCFNMAHRVKHLKDSFVAYMNPIQKAPASNTVESAERLSRLLHYFINRKVVRRQGMLLSS